MMTCKEIVNKLDSFLSDPQIMEQIAIAYRSRYGNYDDSYRRASRDITEIIDENLISQLEDIYNIILNENNTIIINHDIMLSA